jgi:hypothetical protein
MKRALPVLLGIVLSAVATKSYAVNILINPGFESSPDALDPWFNSNDFCSGCTWSVSQVTPHAGDNDAVVNGNRLLEQDFAPVDTADISEASLWLRMPVRETGSSSIAAVFFRYGDGTTEENIMTLVQDNSWQKFDVTSFLDAGKTLVGFGVYGCSGCDAPSITYADDFVVDAGAAPVPEPGTLTLVGIGGAWLAARRRRRNGQVE